MELGGIENGNKVVESWDVSKSKGWMKKKKKKKKKKKEDDVDILVEEEEDIGCWVRLRLFGSCISSRSNVDGSLSGTNTHYAENKSTNDTSRDQPTVPVVSSTSTSNSSNSLSSKLEEELKVSSRLRKFTFNDLKLATTNFRPESLLGESGFGCVFKGWIEENGTAPVKPGTGLTVAVKTLNHDGLQGHKEWLVGVNFFGGLVHPNLVKLRGYCIEDDQRLLVYEFMPHGSLENHLFKTNLSNVIPIQEYNAKLSDFDLAEDGPEGDKTHVSTRVMGTSGYVAPEFVMRGHRTSKSDVYSFGVVLLEMLTGQRFMDKHSPNGEHNLVEWARPHLGGRRRVYRFIDPRLEGHFSIKGAQKAAQVASLCLSRDRKARPLMSEVVEALKRLHNLKDMASSSYYFQTMQADRFGGSPNARNG
ncbi:unnamed protein product [Lupinus luteus]|uniref:non-specific serine/threonine protein kinase n=1 Tax=Lupinus luteus TaxID=3873 RepID=A0AAV1WFK1_LUPLU